MPSVVFDELEIVGPRADVALTALWMVAMKAWVWSGPVVVLRAARR